MAEVILLIALLAQEVSENGGGLLQHLSNVLRSAGALAADIAGGHPSSITPTMAWDMVHNRLTGNFTVDDWVAGLMGCLPMQFRTRAVVTPTYMWDTVDTADFLWFCPFSLFSLSPDHTAGSWCCASRPIWTQATRSINSFLCFRYYTKSISPYRFFQLSRMTPTEWQLSLASIMSGKAHSAIKQIESGTP
jgi:hypothetical protein